MSPPTAPLEDEDLIHHLHQVLTRHLTRLDPALHLVQGPLTPKHIGEVVVDMLRNR